MHLDAMCCCSPMMLLRKYGLNKLHENSESNGGNECHTQGQLNYVNQSTADQKLVFLKQTISTLSWPSEHYGYSNFHFLPYLSNHIPFLQWQCQINLSFAYFRLLNVKSFYQTTNFSNVLAHMLYSMIKRKQSRLLILSNRLYFVNSYMSYLTCLISHLRNGKDTSMHYLSISKGSQFGRNKEFIECYKTLKFKVPCAEGTK